jgi:hypothetical protein
MDTSPLAFSRIGSLLVACASLLLPVGCDGEEVVNEDPSEELLAACLGAYEKFAELAVTNGCTEVDAEASCNVLHGDNGCEEPYRAQYACFTAEATAEDCQCEADDGGPLCNEMEAACEAEVQEVLDCLNRGDSSG